MKKTMQGVLICFSVLLLVGSAWCKEKSKKAILTPRGTCYLITSILTMNLERTKSPIMMRPISSFLTTCTNMMKKENGPGKMSSILIMI